MSKRWDEALDAAGELYERIHWGESFDSGFPKYLEAFVLAAHGPSGPAALKDWVEGRAVLVPIEPTDAMCRAYHIASAKAALEDFNMVATVWEDLGEDAQERMRSFGRAMLAASPTAPDGEPK